MKRHVYIKRLHTVERNFLRNIEYNETSEKLGNYLSKLDKLHNIRFTPYSAYIPLFYRRNWVDLQRILKNWKINFHKFFWKDSFGFSRNHYYLLETFTLMLTKETGISWRETFGEWRHSLAISRMPSKWTSGRSARPPSRGARPPSRGAWPPSPS